MDDKDIRVKAAGVIKEYMGDSLAKSYSEFYQKQNEETVIQSLTELLNEYVGSLRAIEILSRYGLVK